MNHRTTSTVLMALLIATGCGNGPATQPSAQPQPQSLPTVQMRLGSRVMTLEWADEPHEQEIGLMHRHSMPEDHGMIFVFPAEQVRSFWMKNTHIPLDIVYVDGQGRIVSIKTMKPLDLSSVSSDKPAKYAIELNAGMAQKLGLKPGDVIVSK
jgi:uncharacterized protein